MKKIEGEDIKKDVPITSKDISKKTIALLLVVAIILSVASTLIAVARTPQAEEVSEASGSAQISVNVLPPPVERGAQVSLNVVEGDINE